MLLVNIQAYGQMVIAGDTSTYSGISNSGSSNNSYSGYSSNNSIDTSQLTGLSSTNWSGMSPSFDNGVAGYVAMNPNSLSRDCTGCVRGVAAVNPSYGFYSGTAFVGPTMDSDIYTSIQQLNARLAGDEIRSILGRENTLTNAQQYQAEKALQIANFVAGISNTLPNGVVSSDSHNVAFLDTLWDAGNVIYDAGRYVAGKLTGDQQMVDEAATDFVWDTAAAAIPFVPAGATKVLRAADAATNLNRLPDSTVVCRGGTCSADSFVNGSGVTQAADGTLKGVSTQQGNSVNDVASFFKNNQIGVTTVKDIREMGGEVIRDGTIGNPNHATVNGLSSQQLGWLFTPTISNPAKNK